MVFGRFIVERLLAPTLLRFRLAWFLAGGLGCYLALVIVLFTLAQHEATAVGPFTACRMQRDAGTGAITYTFAYALPATHAAGELTLDPLGYTPAIPANLCHQRIVSIVFAQNTLGGPYPINRIVLVARTRPITSETLYTNSAGRDFSAARANTLWLRGGGMALLSGALLAVGLWWERIRRALRLGGREGYADDLPTTMPELLRQQIEEGARWLASLPWSEGALATSGHSPGANVAADEQISHQQRLAQGLSLIRSWGGDDERMIAGVRRLMGLPPALAFIGASAAAFQLAAYTPISWAPVGARLALAYAARALAEDPTNDEAHIVYTQALAALGAAGDADRLRQAEAAYCGLHQRAPAHPQLPLTLAMLHLAHRRYGEAGEALQRALPLAATESESQRLLDQLATTLRRQGDFRQIVSVFAWLARGGHTRADRYPQAAAQATPIRASLRPGAGPRPGHH